jgi:hypothetical protein
VAGFHAAEEKLYRDYIDFKVMETLQRAHIESLGESLQRIKGSVSPFGDPI